MEKKKKRKTPCSSPSSCRPSARSHRASWGCLSLSALRPSGRARAHSPGLIYFFKGGSFILVGLGGKEDWGFCTVSTTRPVHFPPFFFLLPLFPQPSFSSQALQSPPQACCLSVPTLLPQFSFLCVSGFPLPFLPLGFQSRWEKGGRMGGASQRGAGPGWPREPWLRPPGGGACLVPPREGARAWEDMFCCVPPGDVH